MFKLRKLPHCFISIDIWGIGAVSFTTGQTDDDRPLEYLVSASDNRLTYIIDTYNDAPDDNRERLYKYAKKLSFDHQKGED